MLESKKKKLNLLSSPQLVLINRDDLIARIQLYSRDRSIRILNGPMVPLERSLDHSDRNTDKPIPRTTANVPRTDHTAGI